MYSSPHPTYSTTTYTTPSTTTSTTSSHCKEDYEEIGDDSPYFGPDDDRSSEQETDNVFTNPRGPIKVVLKFNAYQVIKADIETVNFLTKRVGFASGIVTTKGGSFKVKVRARFNFHILPPICYIPVCNFLLRSKKCVILIISTYHLLKTSSKKS